MTRLSQARQLQAAGVSPAEVEELLRYAEMRFPAPDSAFAGEAPLSDEPFVDCWRSWAEAAQSQGTFTILREHLPQLRFPIREGISGSQAYRAATLSGVSTVDLEDATGLRLEDPDSLELQMHASFAGTVPVLVARHRSDFERLVQALAKRNEPLPVPAAQGAVTVGGYNNWTRLRGLREAWQTRDPSERDTSTWREEFARLRPQKHLYQDRVILLSDGPYSNVAASALGLDERKWRRLSFEIRREHECAHYFTRRVYGQMRNHLLDELLADYIGLTAAIGRFRASWFLRFVGLEAHPDYRPGSRLDLYRGDPAMSDGAFRVLHHLVVAAASAIEAWDTDTFGQRRRGPEDQARAIQTLAALGLLDLAAEDAAERLTRVGSGFGLIA